MTWASRTDHKEVQGPIDPLDRIVGYKSECIIKTHQSKYLESEHFTVYKVITIKNYML